LTGGGSFGAFEAGAIQAFFDRWQRDHGELPPIRVIAGTSTGALIGPFVALGPSGVHEVADLYTNVGQGDILSIKVFCDILPFALFSRSCSSAYGVGPLKNKLAQKLPDAKLTEIGKGWPERRLGVLATDFGNGRPAIFTNSPEDLGTDSTQLARFRDGVLASTISPLATPPVYIKPNLAKTDVPTFDGGIHAVTPIQLLFDLAARSPEIELTQVIVFSAYPPFPSDDSRPVQTKRFPGRPNFGDTGSRMDALISESSITKEVALAWAAIELRKAGVTAQKVRERTGLYILRAPRELVLIAPDTRLGWDNLKFDKGEMRQMFERGLKATPHPLIP
jgi:predicted acylesterase/phospholipase RssA